MHRLPHFIFQSASRATSSVRRADKPIRTSCIVFHFSSNFSSANRMDLYLKAGPDGKSVGDCPFAHYVRMVAHVKALKVSLHPCPAGDSAEKPDWLKRDFDGKMPCLDDGGKRIADSADIAKYLDEKYPEPKLGAGEGLEEASQAVKGVFPATAKLVKSLEGGEALEKGLDDAVKEFAQYWKNKPEGDFLLGKNLSLLDCSLAPKLYHMDVALKKFHPEVYKCVAETEAFRAGLKPYMDTILKHDAFAATKYAPEVVEWGWGEARKEAASGGKTCAV